MVSISIMYCHTCKVPDLLIPDFCPQRLLALHLETRCREDISMYYHVLRRVEGAVSDEINNFQTEVL